MSFRAMQAHGVVNQDLYESELENILHLGRLGLGDMTQGTIVAPTGNPSSTAAAINRVLAQGGVVQLLPGEYLIDQPLVVHSRSAIVGAGPNQTRIKVQAGANVSGIKTAGFDDLTGQNVWLTADGVVYGFVLRGFELDGSAGNVDSNIITNIAKGTAQTTGTGIQIFGKGYWIDDVVVHQFIDDGLYTECGGSVANGYSSFNVERPEAFIGRVFVGYNGRHGWSHNGPNDTVFDRVVLGRNNYGKALLTTSAMRGDYIHAYGGRTGLDIGDRFTATRVFADFVDPGVWLRSGSDNTHIQCLRGLQPGERASGRSNYEDGNHGTLLKIDSGADNIGLDSIYSEHVTEQEAEARCIDIGSGASNLRIGMLRIDGPASGFGVGCKIGSRAVIARGTISGYAGTGGRAIVVDSGAGEGTEIDLTVFSAQTALDWNDTGTAVNAEIILRCRAGVTTAVSGTIGASAFRRIDDGGTITGTGI